MDPVDTFWLTVTAEMQATLHLRQSRARTHTKTIPSQSALKLGRFDTKHEEKSEPAAVKWCDQHGVTLGGPQKHINIRILH